MAYSSSCIRGAMASRSMPDLERFAQDEASRLQAEISLLEQQVTQLDVQRPVPKVNRSATRTDEKDYALVNKPTKVFKKLFLMRFFLVRFKTYDFGQINILFFLNKLFHKCKYALTI